MTPSVPIRRRIVLIGGGHTHVLVLRAFGMRPEPGVGLTIVAKELDAPYSGMLPGWVAGHYSRDDCTIDIVRLARFADARLIHGEAIGVDRSARQVQVRGRPPVGYDLLSIDAGITPLLDGIAGAGDVALTVKPVSTFGPRWTELLARALTPEGPRRFVVIGTGAAGFELVLAIRHRLLAELPKAGLDTSRCTFTLIGSGRLLATLNARARRHGRDALVAAGIDLIEDDAAVAISTTSVTLASGRVVACDAALVTTKAGAPPWLRQTDLTCDAHGFVAARATLQMRGDDDVFGVGDCASVIEHPREKAGVFAVRQGPPLERNLRLRARGEAAVPFRPQRQWLTLLSLGGKSAIAARGPFTASGDWVWRWKDVIDRRFMDTFAKLPAMAHLPQGAETDADMRCGGCAAKLGPAVLQGALDRLDAGAQRAPQPRDDAAIIDEGGDTLRLETVDFFRAFWPEPYLFGAIAAEHALSDIYAMGGVPQRALAIAVLPYAGARQSADDLFQLMAGARATFDRAGVALVGGHSSEGAELGAGFFVSGGVARDRLLRKGGLAVGDALMLTKPLGTGILFAGWMRRLARARDITVALDGMRKSNGVAARILSAQGVTAMTDVTGFGLAGHLLEMLEASGVGAVITLDQCRRYSGVDDLIGQGVRSTLLSENMALADRVGGKGATDAALALLLDPQTSGGLLTGIEAGQAERIVAELATAGVEATIVGRVVAAPAEHFPRIMIE